MSDFQVYCKECGQEMFLLPQKRRKNRQKAGCFCYSAVLFGGQPFYCKRCAKKHRKITDVVVFDAKKEFEKLLKKRFSADEDYIIITGEERAGKRCFFETLKQAIADDRLKKKKRKAKTI